MPASITVLLHAVEVGQMKRSLPFGLLLLCVTWSCWPLPAWAALPGHGGRSSLSPKAQQELSAFISGGKLPDLRWPDFTDYRGYVGTFYNLGGSTFAWLNSGHPTSQAAVVISALQQADDVGLNADDYDGTRWEGRLMRFNDPAQPPDEDEQVRFDLAVTVCVMRYISDLHIGRVNPRSLRFELNPLERKYDLPQLLHERVVNASDVATVLAQVEPPFDGYRRTQRALRDYIKFSREDSDEKLPSVDQPIPPGARYAGIPRLGSLLRVVGDLPPNAAGDVEGQTYKGAMIDAVRRFQRRHGLDVTGYLDQQTIEQLNVPLGKRVEQLQLTLERWRWLPFKFASPPIVVNIPQFQLWAFKKSGDPDLSMIVEVGQAYRSETPVFHGDISYLVFHPYWNVTPNIQRRDFVPEIEKNRGYLHNTDYEVLDPAGHVLDSTSISDRQLAQLLAGTLRIRQKPGANNALGLVKFIFPNAHNVYLHGSPEPELFSRSRRDFSHGCIRLSNPAALAQWVLRNNPGWTKERILAAMNGPRPQQVDLASPVPVLIVYGTAFVDVDGQVNFFDDIYGHDAALRKALAKGYPYKGW